MVCKRCEERGGKTWHGDDPKCGFPEGTFWRGNWNCATLNQLRYLAEDLDNRVYGMDESAALIPMPEDDGGFILLTWYKNRGSISGAFRVGDSSESRDLTLAGAEIALDAGGRV